MERTQEPRLLKLAMAGLCVLLFPGATNLTDTPRVGQLEERLLAAHNLERAKLGLAPLSWSEDLAQGAQDWARHLSITGQFKHSPNRPGAALQGENIWGGTAKAFTPEDMVAYWIAEKRHFKAGTFPNNSLTGNPQDVSHYTQVVWQETREVGCGLAYADGEEVLVCRYTQPGNIVGEKPF